MNKILTSGIVFLFTLLMFSCITTNKNLALDNIANDFPQSEELIYKPYKNYEFVPYSYYLISDSLAWVTVNDRKHIGFCYNLNTGKKLSVIGFMGKANYEFLDIPFIDIKGDTVFFYEYEPSKIKIFSKTDIINNKPMSERELTLISIPDSINLYNMRILPNGSILGLIHPIAETGTKLQSSVSLNNKSLVLFNNTSIKTFKLFDDEQHDVKDEPTDGRVLTNKEQLKIAYGYGLMEVKNNDVAVFSINDQFILYTFDLNKGNVLKEKRYTNIRFLDATSEVGTTNDIKTKIYNIQTNDKYIAAFVQGYFNHENLNLNNLGFKLYIFDWNLKPIKSFDLPKGTEWNSIISEDFNSITYCQETEDGSLLYKADLNL